MPKYCLARSSASHEIGVFFKPLYTGDLFRAFHKLGHQLRVYTVVQKPLRRSLRLAG